MAGTRQTLKGHDGGTWDPLLFAGVAALRAAKEDCDRIPPAVPWRLR